MTGAGNGGTKAPLLLWILPLSSGCGSTHAVTVLPKGHEGCRTVELRLDLVAVMSLPRRFSALPSAEGQVPETLISQSSAVRQILSGVAHVRSWEPGRQKVAEAVRLLGTQVGALWCGSEGTQWAPVQRAGSGAAPHPWLIRTSRGLLRPFLPMLEIAPALLL